MYSYADNQKWVTVSLKRKTFAHCIHFLLFPWIYFYILIGEHNYPSGYQYLWASSASISWCWALLNLQIHKSLYVINRIKWNVTETYIYKWKIYFSKINIIKDVCTYGASTVTIKIIVSKWINTGYNIQQQKCNFALDQNFKWSFWRQLH